MNVLLLTVFVSLVLAALGVGLFVWTARSRTFEHADRLAILPLEEECVVAVLAEHDPKSSAAVDRAAGVVEV